LRLVVTVRTTSLACHLTARRAQKRGAHRLASWPCAARAMQNRRPLCADEDHGYG